MLHARHKKKDFTGVNLTGKVFYDDSVGRLVDVGVEGRVRLPLEPGDLLPDHLVTPPEGNGKLAGSTERRHMSARGKKINHTLTRGISSRKNTATAAALTYVGICGKTCQGHTG